MDPPPPYMPSMLTQHSEYPFSGLGRPGVANHTYYNYSRKGESLQYSEPDFVNKVLLVHIHLRSFTHCKKFAAPGVDEGTAEMKEQACLFSC